MAKVTDFISVLSGLRGVDGYLLAQGRGQILSHNLTDSASYMIWAHALIQRCASLSSALNNESLRGASFQQNGRFIHLFPIRQYQLVVLQSAENANVELSQQIEALIQETVERG
nr:hypothetical protein [uncultured Desulfuromonas sp.]